MYTSSDQLLRGKVHMNNAKDQIILVHVDVVHRPTPEICDDSVFKIG